jgi:hypothetical protein
MRFYPVFTSWSGKNGLVNHLEQAGYSVIRTSFQRMKPWRSWALSTSHSTTSTSPGNLKSLQNTKSMQMNISEKAGECHIWFGSLYYAMVQGSYCNSAVLPLPQRLDIILYQSDFHTPIKLDRTGKNIFVNVFKSRRLLLLAFERWLDRIWIL